MNNEQLGEGLSLTVSKPSSNPVLWEKYGINAIQCGGSTVDPIFVFTYVFIIVHDGK